jgi:hypothetical protein
MRTFIHTTIKPFLAAFIFSIIYFTAHAQTASSPHDSLSQVIKAKSSKLPNTQQASVRAPDNIKIDGKTTEWDDNFYAKNTFNRISYTLSNDDNKLYLTVQTLGNFGNEKIVNGGVTFTISHSDKRKREKDPDNVSITFPLTNKAEASSINDLNYDYFDIDAEERPAHKKECDSLVKVINERADKIFKEIKIKGIKDVDTLVSVYNATGIKAVARFDQNMRLVYELAIPLKYLGLTTSDPVKFSYNIKLNGPPRIIMPVLDNRPEFTPGAGVSTAAATPRLTSVVNGVLILGSGGGAPDPDIFYRTEVSDFWGDYTLAKK